MSEVLKRRMRCAVYTRKSTDEGLDQEYNSIDAQRDATFRPSMVIGMIKNCVSPTTVIKSPILI